LISYSEILIFTKEKAFNIRIDLSLLVVVKPIVVVKIPILGRSNTDTMFGAPNF